MMAHMLPVAALKVRYPMVLIVQVIADNSADHRTFAFCASWIKRSIQCLIPALITNPLVERAADCACLDSQV